MRAAAVVLLGASLWALPAAASIADVFDLGPAMAQSGAVAASSNSGAAAYYNPAGLAFGPPLQARVGVQGVASLLSRDERNVPFVTPWGLLVETSGRLPLAAPVNDRIALGIALYIPTGLIVGIDSPAGTDAFFPYYENRLRRIVAIPALAVRLTDQLALGAGLNYFASLEGTVRAADAAEGAVRVDVEQKILHLARPHFGVRFDLTPLQLAVSYRAAFAVPFVSVNENSAAGAPARLELRSRAMYTPQTLVAAGAVQVGAWRAEVDASLRFFSQMPSPITRLDASVRLPGASVELAGQTIDRWSAPRDVLRLALGLTWHSTSWLELAGGWAFEPTPFVGQSGGANALDGDKHLIGLGVVAALWRAAHASLTVELSGQAHFLRQRVLRQDPTRLPDVELLAGRQTNDPGYPELVGGGAAFAAALTLVYRRGAP